ncbi:MAG: hypothetical protein JO081_08960 [Alphaproteobacteria bacterium]|nr:hypothetical protein [Alphaproteobacteria bacterium]
MRPFTQGFWSGGAYIDERTGVFTHCSAGVAYNSGISMFVVTTRTYRWWLGFFHPQWSLTPNAKPLVELRFDGIARFKQLALIPNGKLMLVPLPESPRAITALRRAPDLYLIAQGSSFLFKLPEISAVLDQLTNCTHTSIVLEALGIPTRAAGAASSPAAAPPASASTTGASALGSSTPSAAVTVPGTRLSPAVRAAASSVTPVETGWASIIAIGALMGAIGQGVRIIVGLGKARDTRRHEKFADPIASTRLTIVLLIGALAGAIAAIASAPGSPVARMVLFGAAGYSGADLVERLIARSVSPAVHTRLLHLASFVRQGLRPLLSRTTGPGPRSQWW